MTTNNKSTIVIWGHKPGTHTHSFIHQAFFKAFKEQLGAEVLWLDNSDDTTQLSETKSYIFITEGQVDAKIPILKNSKYILHNCNLKKYDAILSNTLNLQVFTKKCLTRDIQNIDSDSLIFYQDKPVESLEQVGVDNRTIYMPWATNLLPREILKRTVEENVKNKSLSSSTVWIGSVCDGEQGNLKELEDYSKVCKENKIGFFVARPPEGETMINMIRHSHTAPAIQGKWQVENGYIPCRVFKNVSYGRLCSTNNKQVFNLFQGMIPYSETMSELFQKESETENSVRQKDLDTLVSFVKNKHTYLNRIANILEVL
jgi:type I restriction-modification system DNA methylase subunit